MLRKSHPNFQHYVKKIKAQAKKWFSYKKVQSSSQNTYFVKEVRYLF